MPTQYCMEVPASGFWSMSGHKHARQNYLDSQNPFFFSILLTECMHLLIIPNKSNRQKNTPARFLFSWYEMAERKASLLVLLSKFRRRALSCLEQYHQTAEKQGMGGTRRHRPKTQDPPKCMRVGDPHKGAWVPLVGDAGGDGLIKNSLLYHTQNVHNCFCT